MSIEHDDAFLDIGYTSPDRAQELRAARLEKTAGSIVGKTTQMSSPQRSRRARAAVGPQFGEEAGVGYPGGKTPEHQDLPPLSDEQHARNSHFKTNWRKVAAEAIKNGTHAVED